MLCGHLEVMIITLIDKLLETSEVTCIYVIAKAKGNCIGDEGTIDGEYVGAIDKFVYHHQKTIENKKSGK